MRRKSARNEERFVLDFSGEIAFLCFEENLISVHNTPFAFSLYSRTTDDTDKPTDFTDPTIISPPEEAWMGSVNSARIK